MLNAELLYLSQLPLTTIQLLERDRLCGHLAKLEEDINVKERLVAELQRNDKRLAKMRQVYERKLNEMSERIQATETERDRILAEMNSKQQEGLHDKIRAVREEYEKRIHALREEHRRLKDQSFENKRMLAQQERQKSELEKIQHELLEMKRAKVALKCCPLVPTIGITLNNYFKVDLTKRLKEENRRIREIQTSTAKQVAGYEKNARKQENAMRKLQLNLEHKEQQLNRKNEEMQKLRVKQKVHIMLLSPFQSYSHLFFTFFKFILAGRRPSSAYFAPTTDKFKATRRRNRFPFAVYSYSFIKC